MMTVNEEPPASKDYFFGLPRSREEFRLFDRWTLWVKYTWFVENGEDREKDFRDKIAAAQEAMAVALGGKLVRPVDVPNHP